MNTRSITCHNIDSELLISLDVTIAQEPGSIGQSKDYRFAFWRPNGKSKGVIVGHRRTLRRISPTVISHHEWRQRQEHEDWCYSKFHRNSKPRVRGVCKEHRWPICRRGAGSTRVTSDLLQLTEEGFIGYSTGVVTRMAEALGPYPKSPMAKVSSPAATVLPSTSARALALPTGPRIRSSDTSNRRTSPGWTGLRNRKESIPAK